MPSSSEWLSVRLQAACVHLKRSRGSMEQWTDAGVKRFMGTGEEPALKRYWDFFELQKHADAGDVAGDIADHLRDRGLHTMETAWRRVDVAHQMRHISTVWPDNRGDRLERPRKLLIALSALAGSEAAEAAQEETYGQALPLYRRAADTYGLLREQAAIFLSLRHPTITLPKSELSSIRRLGEWVVSYNMATFVHSALSKLAESANQEAMDAIADAAWYYVEDAWPQSRISRSRTLSLSLRPASPSIDMLYMWVMSLDLYAPHLHRYKREKEAHQEAALAHLAQAETTAVKCALP